MADCLEAALTYGVGMFDPEGVTAVARLNTRYAVFSLDAMVATMTASFPELTRTLIPRSRDLVAKQLATENRKQLHKYMDILLNAETEMGSNHLAWDALNAILACAPLSNRKR
jgi:hypothetical protein